MAPIKILLYVALFVGVLVLASVVASIVLAALTILWALVTTAITIAVLGALVYGGYKLYRLFGSSGSERTESMREDGSASSSGSSIERLQEKYTSGQISEAELERRLEYELDEPGDSIDRELNRDRS